MKITFYRETIADAGSDAVKCGIDKSDAPGVIGSCNSVFSDIQVTVKIFCHPAQNMLSSFRVKLIIHLGQFGTLRIRKLTVRTDQGAGIILHA